MWQHIPEKRYSVVPKSDFEDSNLNAEEFLHESPRGLNEFSPARRTCSQIVVLVVSMCLSIIAGVAIGTARFRNLDQVCALQTTRYSPVLDDVKIKYTEWQFNGSFTHENIYRQDPSKEVDRAWEALGINNRVLVISEDEGRRSGLSPENHVQVNKKYGGGYPVMTEGLHQLHCLNLLRKSLWYTFDHYNATHHNEFSLSNAGQPFRWHVTHCLDILRQRLMCDVDTGVFGAVWYGNVSDPMPFVDFNTRHTCKNFNDVREWAMKRQTPEELPDDYWEMPDPEKVNIRPEIP